MKHVRWSVSLFVLFALTLAFIGCSKPPEAEKQAAKAAMDAALSAGADKYAIADLNAAKKIWDEAESQMKDKKYKEAKQSYIDAKVAFEKAAKAVEAGKKIADEARAAITTIEKAWENLEATAKKMERKMKDKKEAWIADAKTFTEGMAKAKEMIDGDPAGVKAKLDDLKTMVDKWENKFKEMAAAPAKPEAPKKKKK
jgi:hypothetical protein